MKKDTMSTDSKINYLESSVEELMKAGRLTTMAQTPTGIAPFVVLPAGYKAEYLNPKPLPDLPDHIRGNVRLDDPGSFVAYVKLFKSHTTRIFATAAKLDELAKGSAGGAKFTALLDYHEQGKDGKAQRVAHIATYPCPLSLEIRTWLASNGKGLSQMDFVQFIEANCVDVVTPDAASLMELAMNFESKSQVEFSSKVDRLTGARGLKFTETVDTTPTAGQLKVPETLALRVPIFEGGKTYDLSARLEYRPSNGKLAITYHLQRPHVVFRQALADLRSEIQADTQIEVLTGEVLAKEISG